MNHRILLLTVVASLALAGCAGNEDAGAPTPTTSATPTSTTTPSPTVASPTPTPTADATPTPATPDDSGDDADPTVGAPVPPMPEEACDALAAPAPVAAEARDGDVSVAEGQQLFDQSIAGMTGTYDMHLRAEMSNGEEMTIAGTFPADADTEAFMLMCGLPSEMAASGLPYTAVAMYTRDGAAAWALGSTVTVTAEGAGEATGASPSEFTDLGRPSAVFGLDNGGNVSVVSARAVTYDGQDAVELVVNGTDDEDTPVDATVIVTADGSRVLQLQTQETNEDDPEDPLSNALITLRFLDAATLGLEVPEHVERALGLAYATDANPFAFGGEGGEDTYTETWTFHGDAGIPLDEVFVLVQASDEGGQFGGGFTAASDRETLWSMRLSDGSHTEGTLTLTYDDADGDGAVSPGDTLLIEDTGSGHRPTLVLFDTQTGAYVTPGPGFALALGALALLAAALRRRA